MQMTASVLQVGLPQAQTAISIQFTYLEVDFCFCPSGRPTCCTDGGEVWRGTVPPHVSNIIFVGAEVWVWGMGTSESSEWAVHDLG